MNEWKKHVWMLHLVASSADCLPLGPSLQFISLLPFLLLHLMLSPLLNPSFASHNKIKPPAYRSTFVTLFWRAIMSRLWWGWFDCSAGSSTEHRHASVSPSFLLTSSQHNLHSCSSRHNFPDPSLHKFCFSHLLANAQHQPVHNCAHLGFSEAKLPSTSPSPAPLSPVWWNILHVDNWEHFSM